MTKALMWVKFYVWNILLAVDQLGNALIAGDPAETISRRAGQAAAQGKLWGCYLCAVLNAIDARHCMTAQERMDTGIGDFSVSNLMKEWKNGNHANITG